MIRRQTVLPALCVCLWLGSSAFGQEFWLRRNACLPVYSPATAISAQIHAEAAFLSAYGQASVDMEVARAYRAKAVKMEIDNSVDYVKAYWERRALGEAERMKRHKTLAQKTEIQNSHLWRRLRDHPELSVEAIPNGTALNFLLDRMAGGVLAYHFSAGSDNSLESLSQLEIDPKTLEQLRVRQDLPSGGRTVFRLHEGKALDLGWWPAALRGTEFTLERRDFEKSKLLLSASTTDESFEIAMKKVFESYDSLVDAFYARHTRSVRLKSVNDHREYGLAKRYLQSLAGELYRIRSVGPKAVQSDSLKFEGTNLIALLTHMSRNGLEFAPSLPGEEPAYHQVFHMMRDLYVTVAEDVK